MSAFSDFMNGFNIPFSLPLWLRLGESSGTTAVNAGVSGPALDGTYVNAPTLGVTGSISGDADTAVTLTAASSQRITIPHNSAIAGNVATFGLRYKRNGAPAGTEVFYSKRAATPTETARLAVGVAGVPLLVLSVGGTNTTVVGTKSIIDNAWHSIVVTKQATNARLFVDGVVDGEMNPGTLDSNTADIWIGGITGAGTFPTCTVDEVFYTLDVWDVRTIWNYHCLADAAGRRPHPRLDTRTGMRRFHFSDWSR